MTRTDAKGPDPPVLVASHAQIGPQPKDIAETKDDLVKDLEEVDPHENGEDAFVGLAAEAAVLPVSIKARQAEQANSRLPQ